MHVCLISSASVNVPGTVNMFRFFSAFVILEEFLCHLPHVGHSHHSSVENRTHLLSD